MRRESEHIEASMAALADGTIAVEQRQRLLAEVSESADLTAKLARQRQAVAITGLLEELHAPPALQRSIQSLAAEASASKSARSQRRRLLPSLVAAGAAGLAAAIAIFIAGHSPTNPTVLRAAQLAQQPAALPAPAESASNRDALDVSVEGIAYPYWQGALGWRAAGARTDTLAGRTVTTVFYERPRGSSGRRVGYAIVSGRALPLPHGATVVRRGITFKILRDDGATIVTWHRTGHTCVLVARGVATHTLLRLASWE
jgi:hypothetical protein